MIEIAEARYSYPAAEGQAGREALRGVSLRIEDGAFVAVLGRNGSGKSTLAKLVNALIIPDGGAVYIDGKDTREEENVWFARSHAGMVFQNPDNQLVATIVEDDVAFGAENLGLPPTEIRARVDAALKAVDMAEHAKKAPHLLSGGQKQRVAIAGVLAMKPATIILDEPTAMLDPSGRREVMEAAIRLNAQDGITVLLITHYMDEAALAGRVVVMDGGAVIMDGTPREVFSRGAELRAAGLDVPHAAEIADGLRGRGVPLAQGIYTNDELVKALVDLRDKHNDRG